MIETTRVEYVLPPRVRRGLRAAAALMRRGYRVAGLRRGFFWRSPVHAFLDEREYPYQKNYGPREAWTRIPHMGLVALPPEAQAGHAWPDAQLAEAEYDALRGVLTITAENGAQHVFSGRLGGVGMYRRPVDLFQAVNEVAKEVHCLVDRVTVVNAVAPVYDHLAGDPEDRVVRNDHAKAYIVGAAVEEDADHKRWIIWAALAGPRIALESLRVTLGRGNTLKQGRGWHLNWRLRHPAAALFTVQPVPDLPGLHLLIVAQEALLAADREHAVGYIVLADEHESPGPHLIRLLQQATDLPMLPDWGDVLWQAAQEGVSVLTHYGRVVTVPLVKQLQVWGVVRAAWRVDLTPAHWTSLLSTLLREGRLSLEKEVDDAAAG